MNIWTIASLIANSSAVSRVGRRALLIGGAWIAARAGEDTAALVQGIVIAAVGEGLSWLSRKVASMGTPK